jgi:hypothetical protein
MDQITTRYFVAKDGTEELLTFNSSKEAVAGAKAKWGDNWYSTYSKAHRENVFFEGQLPESTFKPVAEFVYVSPGKHSRRKGNAA